MCASVRRRLLWVSMGTLLNSIRCAYVCVYLYVRCMKVCLFLCMFVLSVCVCVWESQNHLTVCALIHLLSRCMCVITCTAAQLLCGFCRTYISPFAPSHFSLGGLFFFFFFFSLLYCPTPLFQC